jgi:NADPH:quinone reductase
VTTRAARLHDIGSTLRLDEIDDPVPEAGDVLVDVAFASVNPLDVWITRGNVGAAAAHLPWVPGTEATGYSDGRAVLVRGAGLGVLRPGLYCDRVAVPASAVQEVPAGLDLAQVAGLPVAGITAWQALHACGHLQSDDRVLVLGASGGVGSVAVQLAALTGARVWGQTGSAENVSIIEADGAECAVVSDAAGLVDAVVELNPTMVLDPLGGAFTDHAIAALADRGRLVVYGTSQDEMVTLNWRRMYRKAITVVGYSGLIDTAEGQRDILASMFALMAEGRLHLRLGAVLPLADAAESHARIVERRARGKLILDCRA